MMQQIINQYLLWMQIGIQILAMFFIYKILMLKNTTTMPYIVIFIAMFFILVLRIDNIYKFLPAFYRTIAQLIASVSFVIYFVKIYRKALNQT